MKATTRTTKTVNKRDIHSVPRAYCSTQQTQTLQHPTDKDTAAPNRQKHCSTQQTRTPQHPTDKDTAAPSLRLPGYGRGCRSFRWPWWWRRCNTSERWRRHWQWRCCCRLLSDVPQWRSGSVVTHSTGHQRPEEDRDTTWSYLAF